MSDTSVADQGDDADTKTTPDQPGQPDTQSQPRTWRPPPGLPTPLGVLASQLSLATQAAPASPLPQPAPLPPFDQAQQRAIKREAPYARPTGAFPPYRESPVQTYVPARPIRDPHEWGTSEPYANTPATWELPGMWQGIGQKLSQTGSGVVAGIAGTLLAPLSGSIMKSYVAGQTARIKLDHERAVDAAWQTDRQLDVELRDARDSFALFGGDVTSWTGENKDISLKNVGRFMDSQRAIAARNNDYYLQAAIDSGDFKRIENLWKERDATSRDLKASLKQQEQSEAEAPYRTQAGPGAPEPKGQSQPATGDVIGPNGITLGESPQAGPNPPQAAPASPSPSPADETAASDEGEPPADTTDDGLTGDPGEASDVERAKHLLSPSGGEAIAPVARSPAPQEQPDVPSAEAQPQEATAPGPADQFQPPPAAPVRHAWQPTPSRALLDARNQQFDYRAIDEDAQEMVAGRKTAASYKGNPVVGGLVQQRAREINGELQKIRDSNLRGDDVINAVHRVAPNIASDLKGIVDGAMQLPSASGMAGIRPYPMMLANFAHKARPNWAPYNYTNMAQFSNPNSRTQLTLTRARTMGTAAQNLLTDINKLPDDSNRFQAQIDFFLKNGFAQDERYQRVFADWQAFAIESNVLRTGGTGSVTETEQMIKTLPLFGSKQQYRAVVQRDIDVAESNIAAKRALWGRYNEGNPQPPSMPGDYAEGDSIFGAIKRMNVSNGFIPGDVPPSLQGAIPKSVGDAANWVRSNIMSPDPATRAKALQIQQWLNGEQ